MAVTQSGPAPYTSPQTILELIRRYRDRGLQSPFTRDVLVRAGVPETMITRTLQALVILDLVDSEGKPTATFEALRRAPQAEYSQRFTEFLRAAYQEVFAFIDPMTSTFAEVRDAFRAYQPHGQQDRMVALYLGLCEEAGILGENARQRATRDPQRRQPILRAAERILRARQERQVALRQSSSGDSRRISLPSALSGLLDSLPSDGEAWTARRRNDFLKTFGAVLDFCFPIAEEGATKPTQDEGVEQ